MKIRSRGLGRRELEMDLREFTVERDGTGVLLKGVTHAPITWETTVWVGPRDVGTILRMAAHLAMLRLGLAWVLRRPDVPAVDHAGERLVRAAAGGAVAGGRQAASTATADTTAPAEPAEGTVAGPDPAPAAVPPPTNSRPTGGRPDGATPAPAPAPAPSASRPPRPRPERLVRAERPPKPPRPPRPPRPALATRPDQRERHAVGAAGGPSARPTAGADGSGKED